MHFSFLSLAIVFLGIATQSIAQTLKHTIPSPDKSVEAIFILKDQTAFYQVRKGKTVVLESSRLGLVRQDGDFAQGLTLKSKSAITPVHDSYRLYTGKRTDCSYSANKQVFHLANPKGQKLSIAFQVSNDGVAFRYEFPDSSQDVKRITQEVTDFNLGPAAKAWLQPKAEAKTGWSRCNPSYEEYYMQGIAAGTASPNQAGWVFPALFQTKNTWVLLTETFPDEGNYPGTCLGAASPGGRYSIRFPDSREVVTGKELGPESTLPWRSPWRIVTAGSLKTIVESTLGTDLASPAAAMKTDFIRPGTASWSWILLKDDSTIFPVQKRFIDYASDMGWAYCLVDGEWDRRIGYDKIQELADYAKTKNVGLLLWYNSNGTWNDAPQTPKDLMMTTESRQKEFGRIAKMGIKGVKVDFFGGDGQSMLAFQVAILKDAAVAGLMVNFHGTTLPRGLQRTYPNLITAEAIRGMEFRTFEQANEDPAATHCAMLPFTRNAFDPMDFTPMVLDNMPGIKRKTTNGFELALPFVFTSGIQHLAEVPAGMAKMPDFVKALLHGMPAQWDETRFIDGFPGKFAVIARRSGTSWYVSGINAETAAIALKMDLSFLKGYKPGTYITDSAGLGSLVKTKLGDTPQIPITIGPGGGFVAVFTK